MQLFTNNAASKLASNISAVSLSLQVKTGEGAKFPSPTGGDFFLITLSKVTAGIETAVEIVKCTARTGDALTVVRAQEGTTANAYLVDDRVELRMTAGTATTVESHLSNTSNPHSVTKAQVGLGNVDNTADTDKPVSTVQQTALDLKLDKTGGTITGNVGINGYMGVGGSGGSSVGLTVSNTALTGATQYGVSTSPTFTSSAITAGYAQQSRVITQAAPYTMATGASLNILDSVKGAGSVITDLHGIRVADQTQGTNNYGITSLVSSGTNKWNIYASGTAANLMAGGLVQTGFNAPATGSALVTGYSGGGIINSYNYTTPAWTDLQIGALNLIFKTQNTERLRIDSAGKVAIGHTAALLGGWTGTLPMLTTVGGPVTFADYTANANAPVVQIAKGRGTASAPTTTQANDSLGILSMSGYDAGNVLRDAAGIGAFQEGAATANGVPAYLKFFTSAGTVSGAIERMRLDSAGNLLHNATTAATDPSLRYVQAGTSGAYALFHRTASTIGGGYIGTSGQNLILGTSAGALGAETLTERIRIDSAGNFGLAVTPSAWGTPALQLPNGVGLFSYASTPTMNLGQNVYAASASGTNRYIATAAASLYQQQAGAHYWLTAPSGTAGNAITFTQVLAVEKDKTLALQGATSVTGAGISFPATEVLSTDANTLDAYEEGTFTPTIVGTTVAGAGTYSIQYGSYTKIGNRVAYDIYIVWSAHTGTGNMQVGGLPFTSSATTNAQRAVAIRNSDVTLTASNTMVARLGSNTVAILIEQAPVGGGSVTSVGMDGSGSLHLNGSYTV